MENNLGETVRFTKDLHCAFMADEVENLSVYNPFTRIFDKCELWDDDCFLIAGFNMGVEKDKIRFFYGYPIDYGIIYSSDFGIYSNTFLFIHPNQSKIPEGFNSFGSDYFEKYYKKPSTMWDLAMHIDSYIFYLKKRMHEIKSEHKKWLSEARSKMNCKNHKTVSTDELPF